MAAGALVGPLLLAGCQVTTTIAVDVGASGAGTVTVRVVLDRQAATEVGLVPSHQSAAGAGGSTATRSAGASGSAATGAGGSTATRSAGATGSATPGLDTAGLAAAGWHVTAPVGTAGVTTLTATHHFADLAQLPAVLAGVAASDGQPLFRIEVHRLTTFWATGEQLRGTVDLTCGVACFGDAGLRRVFGSAVGVSVRNLERRYGETPEQALHFSVVVDLPDPVQSTNAARGGQGLTWAPALGTRVTLEASTRRTDRAHVRLVEVAGGVAGALVLGGVVALARKRRRQRSAHAGRGGQDDGAGVPGTVTPGR
ncbi:MAG: hypothetical protein ACYCUG_00465 [Acidimicrobiales bacterium]